MISGLVLLVAMQSVSIAGESHGPAGDELPAEAEEISAVIPGLGVWGAPTALVAHREQRCMQPAPRAPLTSATLGFESPLDNMELRRALALSVCAATPRLRGGFAFLTAGAARRLWVEEGAAATFLDDIRLGVAYQHMRAFADPAGDLLVNHWLAVDVPASRESLADKLIMAPRLATEARLAVLGRLVLGGLASVQWRWHRYRQRSGIGGEMNTQWVIEGGLLAELPTKLPADLGWLSLGARGELEWARPFQGELYSVGGATHWQRSNTLAATLTYAPIWHACVGVSLTRIGVAVQDGIVQPLILPLSQWWVELALTLRI